MREGEVSLLLEGGAFLVLALLMWFMAASRYGFTAADAVAWLRGRHAPPAQPPSPQRRVW
jgi:hypothetical protein